MKYLYDMLRPCRKEEEVKAEFCLLAALRGWLACVCARHRLASATGGALVVLDDPNSLFRVDYYGIEYYGMSHFPGAKRRLS